MGNVVSLRSHQVAFVDPSEQTREMTALSRALQYIEREAKTLGLTEVAMYVGCAGDVLADKLLRFGIVPASQEEDPVN